MKGRLSTCTLIKLWSLTADDMAQIKCIFGLVFLAVCLSFADGGEGMSVGGHYWLLCSVEESVLAISWTVRHRRVPLAILKISTCTLPNTALEKRETAG